MVQDEIYILIKDSSHRTELYALATLLLIRDKRYGLAAGLSVFGSAGQANADLAWRA